MLAQFWKSGGHVKPSGLQVGLLEANMGPKEAFIGGPKFGTKVLHGSFQRLTESSFQLIGVVSGLAKQHLK